MKLYTGINIQFPISEMILCGKKTIETRTYPIPLLLVGKELAFIETPGQEGSFKARIVGTIVFGTSFPYKSKRSFYDDYDRHLVDRHSSWKWTPEKKKFGWPILKVIVFREQLPAPLKKGIKFTKNIKF